MPLDAPASSSPQENRSLQAEIYRLYAALTSTGSFREASGLGGRLLYAGELSAESRALISAANIAGAASLAASADSSTQRAAIRDGVVDFLVTSLEEALRILKNEIRKRQAVSVCVALPPGLLTAQMLDRGVLPDLLPPSDSSSHAEDAFISLGAHRLQTTTQSENPYTTWSLDRDHSRWLPRIDASVTTLLPASDQTRLRWLRLAPRYLGRVAQRQHGLALSASETEQLRTDLRQLSHQHNTDPGGVPEVTIDPIPTKSSS
jgi:Urocanase Rossmann-like domain